jgi:hypothetical protein
VKVVQGKPQLVGQLRSEANNDKPANRCGGALALQRESNASRKLQPRVETGPEIDERSNGSAMRKQRLPVKVRKYLIGDEKVVRPDQPIVFLDAPAIVNMPASHLLAVCGTTQHEPLKGKQLRSRRKFDICLSAKASPIEDDRFLREPGEFRALARFQLCRDARGLV